MILSAGDVIKMANIEFKSTRDKFMFVFFMLLITSALIAINVKITQHELSYTQVQWLAGIGFLFMIVYALSIIDEYIGITTMIGNLFGISAKDETTSSDESQTVQRLLSQKERDSEMIKKQDKTIDGLKQELEEKRSNLLDKNVECQELIDGQNKLEKDYTELVGNLNQRIEKQQNEINVLKSQPQQTTMEDSDFTS